VLDKMLFYSKEGVVPYINISNRLADLLASGESIIVCKQQLIIFLLAAACKQLWLAIFYGRPLKIC